MKEDKANILFMELFKQKAIINGEKEIIFWEDFVREWRLQFQKGFKIKKKNKIDFLKTFFKEKLI